MGKTNLTDLQKFNKRLKEITRALDDFKALYTSSLETNTEDIKILQEAPRIITTVYKAKLKKHLRKFLNENANRFKIASLTELTVIRIQPFRCSNNKELERKLNAEFAFYLSIDVLMGMTPEQYDRDFGSTLVEDFFIDMKARHLEWLTIKPPKRMCIISNEHTLECIDAFYNFRWNPY